MDRNLRNIEKRIVFGIDGRHITGRNVAELSSSPDESTQKSLMQKRKKHTKIFECDSI
jgi:hypothetical protein